MSPPRPLPPAGPSRGASRWGMALAAALGALVAVVLHLPARWLAEPLARWSHGRIELAAAQGTLWRGHAWLTLTGGPQSRDRMSLPTPLHWRLRLGDGALLHLQLHTPCCLPQGLSLRWQPGWSQQQLHLAPFHSQWPASWLTGLGAPWNTLHIDAQLSLTSDGLSVHWAPQRPPRIQGRLELELRDATSRLSTVRPLGSYRLTLGWGDEPSAEGPALELQTTSGSLLLNGHGQWLAGRLRFQGEAAAAPGREEALNHLLNLLGRRVNGRTQIRIG